MGSKVLVTGGNGFLGTNIVHALLEDDGDGIPSQSPWEYEQQGKDGAVAAEFYLKLAGSEK